MSAMSAFRNSAEFKSGIRKRGTEQIPELTHQSKELAFSIQQQAEERAAEAARRVPWSVLLETRNQYLEWQEFYYWARSIMESEQSIPDWLKRRLDEMCPGFLSSEQQYSAKHPGEAALAPVRLGHWIDQHIFDFAKQGGWLSAITFYAVREPRYQRASVCWSESVDKWRKAKPAEYPPFEEWLEQAAHSDEVAHLLAHIRKERECFKLVEPSRLAEAVSRYIDWEAFAYWARAALDCSQPLIVEVARELDARCPGLAEFEAREKRDMGRRLPRGWDRLMLWISDQFFQEAKAEGWHDAVVLAARIHPRAIRTMEYADHCDEVWKGDLPVPYPAFEAWRRDADRYVASAQC
jgi:hypothetical protein